VEVIKRTLNSQHPTGKCARVYGCVFLVGSIFSGVVLYVRLCVAIRAV
jgi:hypothetical protein